VSSTELTVAEVFGPTVQGEGPSCGQRAVFLRLGLCNLDCGAGDGAAWECDTPYTWDWTGKLGTTWVRSEQLARQPIDWVAARLRPLLDDGESMLVVSGGEPMLQQHAIANLLTQLPPTLHVEVETNGTIVPKANMLPTYNVSPKLPNSGVARERAIVPAALQALAKHGGRFKFVVAELADLDDVQLVVDEVGLPDRQVWVMPAGVNPATLNARAALLANEVVRRGWNLSQRLHVQLWGNRRGV